MASSSSTESPTPQVPRNPPESPSELAQKLGQWVRGYFTEVGVDTTETGQHPDGGPKTSVESAPPDPATNGGPAETQILTDVCLPEEDNQNLAPSLDECVAAEIAGSESRVAADPAVSGLLLDHARRFFSSTSETALLAAGEPLPGAPQLPAFILIPSPDPIARPLETGERKWTKTICKFPSACGTGVRRAIRAFVRSLLGLFAAVRNLLSACGRGILYAVRVVLRVPLAIFAAIRKLFAACGRGILWRARALFRVPLTMLAAARKFLSASGRGILYAIRAVLQVPLAIFAAVYKLLSACERGILFGGRAVLRVSLFILVILAAARELLSASAKSIHRGIRALAGIVNVACATTRQFASVCERGFYRAAHKAIKVLVVTFATSRHLLPAFGKSICRGIRALPKLLHPPSVPRFPVSARAQRAVVPVSVLAIMFTFLVSTLRTTTRGASNESTEASSGRVPDANAGTAVALPIQAEAGSHRRVTDPVIYDALANLSRFELAPLKKRAAYGDGDAALLLAMAYETGHELSQSCAKASQWVTVSAEGGNAAAEYNLGLRYLGGDGVPLNQVEGLMWLKKAAAQHYPEANTSLASSRTH